MATPAILFMLASLLIACLTAMLPADPLLPGKWHVAVILAGPAMYLAAAAARATVTGRSKAWRRCLHVINRFHVSRQLSRIRRLATRDRTAAIASLRIALRKYADSLRMRYPLAMTPSEAETVIRATGVEPSMSVSFGKLFTKYFDSPYLPVKTEADPGADAVAAGKIIEQMSGQQLAAMQGANAPRGQIFAAATLGVLAVAALLGLFQPTEGETAAKGFELAKVNAAARHAVLDGDFATLAGPFAETPRKHTNSLLFLYFGDDLFDE